MSLDTKRIFLHNFVYLLIAVALFFILWLLKPEAKYMVRGVFLPAQHQAVKFGKKAKIIAKLPANYVVLGHVSLMLYSHTQYADRQQELSLVKSALKVAALHGGNELYLNQFGYVPPSEVGNLLSGYVLAGTVIKTEA